MKETSVGAIVYQIHDQKIEYLLIHQRHGNHIGFPKGHVELDETHEETATREVLEETGIVCELLNEKFHIHYAPKPGIEKEVIYFAAQYKSGNIQIQTSEIIDAYFKSFEDAYERLTYDNDKQILKIIHTILRKKASS